MALYPSFINNWTFGEITQKLAGRTDLPIYAQGCETLTNFFTMLQGGISRRPPLKAVIEGRESYIHKFSISKTESYLVEMSDLKIRLLKMGVTGMEYVTHVDPTLGTIDYWVTPYTYAQIKDIQYAQYYDVLYIVHEKHPPKYIKVSFNVTFDTLSLTIGLTIAQEARTLCTGAGNYPSVVAVCADRLWFASTENQPSTIWASRPYTVTDEHRNFTVYDTVETTVVSWTDPSTWDTNPDGSYDVTDPTELQADITETNEVITADCSMELQLNSGRNDRIMWISVLGDIIVGTQSAEWVLPFAINPTAQAASQKSNYGSEAYQAIPLGSGFFFIQSGFGISKFGTDQNGNFGVNNISFTADHLITKNIVEVVAINSPYPMLFVLLTDGTVNVLTYDERFQIQAWATWTVGALEGHVGKIMSLATMDTTEGEILYAVVDRGTVETPDYYLEYFDFTEKLHFSDRYVDVDDEGAMYDSYMQTNRFDVNPSNGNSIGKSKSIKSMIFRCIDTGNLYIGFDGAVMKRTSSAVGSDDYEKSVSSGSRKKLKIQLKSFEDEPLNVLAMAFDLEVN